MILQRSVAYPLYLSKDTRYMTPHPSPTQQNPLQVPLLIKLDLFYINMYNFTKNCATMVSMRITVRTVGPTISSYGPGAFMQIMNALLEINSVCLGGEQTQRVLQY